MMSLTVRDIMNRQLLYVSLRDFSADGAGRAVGVVSAIDIVRAFAGVPARYPARFDVDCSSAEAFPDP